MCMTVSGGISNQPNIPCDIMTHAEVVVGFAVAVGVACASVMGLPLVNNQRNLDPQLIKYSQNNNGFGTYSFEFETSDGTYRREDGGILSSSKDIDGSLVVRGEYRFVDPQGFTHAVLYIADANGFQPQTHHTNVRYNDRLLV